MDQTSPIQAVSKAERPKTKGVLLIAIGHPYYSHMAYNLAVSIKYQSPEVKIAVAQSGNSLSQLSPAETVIFDKIIEMPSNFVNGRFKYDPYKAKLHLYELSPYDETLYLDVDMIVSPTKKITDLFNDLSGKDIMFANRGMVEVGKGSLRSPWCDLEEVKSAYGIEKVYDISSEVVWFKKTDEVKKIFKTARKVYDEYRFNVKKFGVGKPDEAFLMVSLALNDVKLNPCPYQPSYWQPFYFNKIHKRDFIQSHYLISVGGAFVTANMKKIYDSIARHYFNRMGVSKHPYQLVSKSRLLKERSKI